MIATQVEMLQTPQTTEQRPRHASQLTVAQIQSLPYDHISLLLLLL